MKSLRPVPYLKSIEAMSDIPIDSGSAVRQPDQRTRNPRVRASRIQA